MSSRDKNKTTSHQPPLSSLVVRPPATEIGGGGDRGGDSGEPRRGRNSSYSRSDRHSGDSGHRLRAASTSPVRRRDADRRHNSQFDRLRSREGGGSRSAGRFRGSSPPRARERGGGRPYGRGPAVPDLPGSLRGEGMNRNNPNVRPREGDWYCPDPLCGNLNFARRESCNNCKRSRHAPVGSSRRGYPGPPLPDALPRRFPSPPSLERSPERPMNWFRSPLHVFARDSPREFGVGVLPPPRHGDGRFADLDHHFRRDRLDYFDHYRARAGFERPIPPLDWGHRDQGRDGFFSERKPFDKRPLSPLPPPPPPHLPSDHGRWGRDVRQRSRSPIRGGPPPTLRDYRRDANMDRGQDNRRGTGRDRIGGVCR